MGKIIYVDKNKETSYIAGTVSYVSPGIGKAEGRVMNLGITLNVYNREARASEKVYLNVACWNESGDGPQIADYVKGNIKVGDFILVKTGEIEDRDPAKDGTARKGATAKAIFKNAIKTIQTDDSSVNIIIGVVRSFSVADDGSVRFSIPVKKGDATTWYNVSCQDKERQKVASRAAKLLTDGTPVAVLSGRIYENTSDSGKTYHNLFAWDFERGFRQQKKEE